MKVTNPATGHGLSLGRFAGPRMVFHAVVLVVALSLALAPAALPTDLAVPAIATLTFVLAAIVALAAYCQRGSGGKDVTYWDVAGAVTLIGICISTVIGPDQMVRIIEGTYVQN